MKVLSWSSPGGMKSDRKEYNMYDETLKEIIMRWLKYYAEKIFAALGSRKLWAAIGATAILLTNTDIPTEFKPYGVAGIWMSFILGTAIEDYGKSR